MGMSLWKTIGRPCLTMWWGCECSSVKSISMNLDLRGEQDFCT
jgi:hypothetical protein